MSISEKKDWTDVKSINSTKNIEHYISEKQAMIKDMRNDEYFNIAKLMNVDKNYDKEDDNDKMN